MISFEVISLLLTAQANQAEKADKNQETDEQTVDDEALPSEKTSIYHRQAVPRLRSQPATVKTPKPSLATPKVQGKLFQPQFEAAFNSFLALASHRPRLSHLFKTILNKLNIKDVTLMQKCLKKLHGKAKRSACRFLINNSLKYAAHGLYLALSLQMPEHVADAFRIVRTEQNLNKYYFGSTSHYYQRP
ncbi:hypothetical protein [Endozoicomonas euniceicola]|uniref:Uncharacterized protein n=1 Tax=Endozoicomonas euniceicola TaxID=1234143 RepID=A0ABY6GYM9_9GAMM|nr:hypothetical protein [Endozoicomonas euniceicola]UYM17890.1 hypothetical protein NX720_08280 [Endozoicomonas euniceicola]